MSRHISPSLLAADFGNLEKEIKKINASEASWLHCDVMDGVFVPNLTFGMPILEVVARLSRKPLDVHLMIMEPEKYIDQFCSVGVDILTVHVEACADIGKAIDRIKKHGTRAGITLRPHTPVKKLKEYIPEADVILIMSVEPGFGGQKFLSQTYDRVAELKDLLQTLNPNALIQADGGINIGNAGKLFSSGVDILVTGTAVFGSSDPVKAVRDLLNS